MSDQQAAKPEERWGYDKENNRFDSPDGFTSYFMAFKEDQEALLAVLDTASPSTEAPREEKQDVLRELLQAIRASVVDDERVYWRSSRLQLAMINADAFLTAPPTVSPSGGEWHLVHGDAGVQFCSCPSGWKHEDVYGHTLEQGAERLAQTQHSLGLATNGLHEMSRRHAEEMNQTQRELNRALEASSIAETGRLNAEARLAQTQRELEELRTRYMNVLEPLTWLLQHVRKSEGEQLSNWEIVQRAAETEEKLAQVSAERDALKTTKDRLNKKVNLADEARRTIVHDAAQGAYNEQEAKDWNERFDKIDK